MYAQTLILVGLLSGDSLPELTGPKLEKGLEVRWAGQFTEASFIPGVRTVRAYDVETRLLVLAVDENGTDVALFTRVFLKQIGKTTEAPAGAVRLELARVDRKGRVTAVPSPADPDNPAPKAKPWPAVKLQGLPYYEAGMFLELPDAKKAGVKDSWARDEDNRPAMAWKVTDVESFRGLFGLKVVGLQATAGFAKPTGARQSEWQRKETLCILPALGFASRFERVIERRDPDGEDLAFRSVLTLEQTGKLTYSGRLFDERREEAVTAAAHTAMLDRLLADGGRGGPKPFEALVRRIDGYQTDHAGGDSVPYREATQAIRKRALSAAKGNLPPVQASVDERGGTPEPDAGPLAVGKPVPDISAEMLTAAATTKLSKLAGRPVLLAYFQTTAASAPSVLKLADTLHAKYRATGVVMPLVIGDTADWKPAYTAAGLTVPVYDGNPVYKTHGLEATPVFVVIDAAGIVRHVARGWGAGTADEVSKEFARWVK